ncbi:Pam3-gp28 family putative phage holin [Sphingomonas sp. PAMC 26605]|uniref:Pam3-gp28 family putative phage holin n=1 Tax=Sphingomonas sp. PAMC 26605 TaxID=1112214 RepID=UPI00026CB0FF|nr:hypothetical protein [Sphingomonas sp. PAMC 26605]
MSEISAPAATVWRAIAGAVVRSLLKIVGTALVTRGLVDQGTVDGAIPMLAEEIAGSLLVAVASGWSVVRAAISHTRFAAAWRAFRGE